MSYDFKKIADLELVNEVPEGANVLIETEGATKRLPSTAINNGYSKDEVYNKNEADEKFLTKETIAKPDWSQNDENAPDYVKNRTHWNEISTIIEEQTISGFASMEDSIYAVQNPFIFSPIVGDSYTVHWDGIAYDVEAQNLDDCICLGNENYLTMNTGGDIPFAILVFGDDNIFVATESTADSHTICIEGEVVHKLDPKYLPNGILNHDLILNFSGPVGHIPSSLQNIEVIGSIISVYNKIINAEMPKVLFKVYNTSEHSTDIMQLVSVWQYGDRAVLYFLLGGGMFHVRVTITAAGEIYEVSVLEHSI